MKPMNNPTKNYMNIKVFDNGSVHVTGCTDIDDFNNVMGTLIKILKKGQDIRTKHNKTRHIEYINDKKKIGIYDAKIRMINSNFKLPYKVDRKKVAFLLKKYHGNRTTDTEIGYVEFKHKPNGGHSCVNIKFKYDEVSTPSIFMFQTGAIIITGAKNLYQIIAAYHYIFLIIDKYLGQIKIIELNPKLVNAEIELYCKERQKKQLCSDENQLNLDLLEANKFNKSDKQKRPNKPINSELYSFDKATPYGGPSGKAKEKKCTKNKTVSKEIRYDHAKIFHFEKETNNPPSDTEYDSVTESEEIPKKKVAVKPKKKNAKNNANRKETISI
jgi:TATA-box binding protein (TBP) (component of TFIID and TFIIIB)